MKLKTLLTTFNAVAPERLAEDWDQVGVHLAGDGKAIKKALLCIDLTPAVLAEAIEKKCKLIVAYHPPIFHPLKRLADRDWKETMLAEAVRQGIAVYSPHTALDAVREGMNDWLCEGLGKAAWPGTSAIASRDSHLSTTGQSKIVVYVPKADATRIRQVMSEAGAGQIGRYRECSFNVEGIGTFNGDPNTNPAIGKPGRLEAVEEVRIEMICWSFRTGDVVKVIHEVHPYEEPAIDVIHLGATSIPDHEEQAPGRIMTLETPVSAPVLIRRLKRTLGVKKLKASIPSNYGTGERDEPGYLPGQIQDIAVCVGAGGSLFEKYPHADAYITGEMQHHQILDLHQKGKVVILAGHTNTERPFLGRYRDRLIEAGGEKVDWLISEADRAPMAIV